MSGDAVRIMRIAAVEIEATPPGDDGKDETAKIRPGELPGRDLA